MKSDLSLIPLVELLVPHMIGPGLVKSQLSSSDVKKKPETEFERVFTSKSTLVVFTSQST